MVWQINAQWKPDVAMKSEVEVRFSADGPNATLVDLLHHKFETMGGRPALRCVMMSIAAGRG